MLPVSAVLSDDKIMDVITPGTHGSTFGGNPLGCSIAIEAINLLDDEKLIDNSKKLGDYFKNELITICEGNEIIKQVRGQGLMIGLELYNKNDTEKIVNSLVKNNILCKSTRDKIIRLSPPLVITKKEIDVFLEIFKKILHH